MRARARNMEILGIWCAFKDFENLPVQYPYFDLQE